MRKLRYFVGCFVGVVMYGAFDGKVKLAENKSTRLPTDPVSYTHLDVYKRQLNTAASS